MSPMRRASTALGQAIDSGGAVASTAPVPQPVAAEGRVETGRPRPGKPIRFTLDLAPDLHRFLKRFATDVEVDAARVMRVLLTQLRDDAELAARVRALVWEEPPR